MSLSHVKTKNKISVKFREFGHKKILYEFITIKSILMSTHNWLLEIISLSYIFFSRNSTLKNPPEDAHAWQPCTFYDFCRMCSLTREDICHLYHCRLCALLKNDPNDKSILRLILIVPFNTKNYPFFRIKEHNISVNIKHL